MQKTNLIDFIDENQNSYYKYVAECNKFKMQTGEKYSYIMSDKPVWGNTVFDLKDINSDLINELKTRIQNKEIPAIISPGMKGTTNVNDNIFLSEGFEKMLTLQGMTLEKKYFKYERITDRLTIKKCEKLEDFILWASIVSAYLFKITGNRDISDYANMMHNCFAGSKNSPNYIAFIGYFENIPVAASSLYTENGIGGIYCVAVHDKYRGRGFGYEITAACINTGINNDIFSYILHASEKGRSVYKKLGFTDSDMINKYILEV
ncbi:MAG: GNAT family N-acetyltransferase [Candidatus Wallbacteria bacterium]